MSSLATLILFSSCSLYKSINRPHPLRSGSTWTLCTTFAFLRIHTIWVGAVVLESLEKILTSSHFSLSFFPVRSRSTDPIPSLTAVRVPLPVVADWTFCTAFPFFDHSKSIERWCVCAHLNTYLRNSLCAFCLALTSSSLYAARILDGVVKFMKPVLHSEPYLTLVSVFYWAVIVNLDPRSGSGIGLFPRCLPITARFLYAFFKRGMRC